MASLPVAGAEELKRTNEIKMAIPLLEAVDIQGKLVSADALLTQRKLADYLVRKRKAHYHFTVKANQPKLFQDIKLFFQDRPQPDFVDDACCDHGRIEIRKIWTTTQLNGYLNFPHVAQAFVIERQCTDKKKAVSTPMKPPMASPVKARSKPTPKACLPPTAATGASRTAATTSSTGTMTKTAAGSARVMARRTSRDSGALRLASSSPTKPCAASHRKCDTSRATYAWSSTICACQITHVPPLLKIRTNLPCPTGPR